MSVTKRAFFTRFLFAMCMAIPCATLTNDALAEWNCTLIRKGNGSGDTSTARDYIQSQIAGPTCAENAKYAHKVGQDFTCSTAADDTEYTVIYYDDQYSQETCYNNTILIEDAYIRNCKTCGVGRRLETATVPFMREYFGCDTVNHHVMVAELKLCVACTTSVGQEGAWESAGTAGYLKRTITYKYNEQNCGTPPTKTEYKCDNGYTGTAKMTNGTLSGCSQQCDTNATYWDDEQTDPNKPGYHWKWGHKKTAQCELVPGSEELYEWCDNGYYGPANNACCEKKKTCAADYVTDSTQQGRLVKVCTEPYDNTCAPRDVSEYKCADDYHATNEATDSTLVCEANCIPLEVPRPAGDWVAYTDANENKAGIEVRILSYNCNITKNQYRCAAGYWSDAGKSTADSADALGCTECPTLDNMQSTSPAGSAARTQCCVEANHEGSDDTGEFILEEQCCATE